MENSAENGGGLYRGFRVHLSLENCVFFNNSASEKGGGLAISSDSVYGSAVITNSTFSRNTAEALAGGGGIYAFGQIVMTNSIMWDNSPRSIHDPDTIAVVTYSNVYPSISGTGNRSTDPRFIDIDSGDLRLRTGSTCIDSANGDVAPDFDINGSPRWDDPLTFNTGLGTPNYSDRGAYEAQSCSGVTCDTPHASYCKDSDIVVTYASSGVCDMGACIYTPVEETCPGGCDAGACVIGSECSSGECCHYGYIRGSGYECREVAGVCDVSDECDGINPECPSDGYLPDSTVCRPARYDCDAEDFCSGESPDCPSDNALPNTVICDNDPYYIRYQCSSSDCGSNVERREQYKYCNGSSLVCPLNNRIWHEWEIVEDCDTNSICTLENGYGSCSTCEWGCDAGTCEPDPCDGVVCNDPPVSFCSDGTTLILFDSVGTCSEGVCDYSSHEEVCPYACVVDHCGCTEGDCCNDGYLKSADEKCNEAPHEVESDCTIRNEGCGNVVLSRELYQFCDGTNPECGFTNIKPDLEWQQVELCDENSFCIKEENSAYCSDVCNNGCENGVGCSSSGTTDSCLT